MRFEHAKGWENVPIKEIWDSDVIEKTAKDVENVFIKRGSGLFAK